MLLFYTSWKHQKVWFLSVFSLYRNGIFAWHDLTCFLANTFFTLIFQYFNKTTTLCWKYYYKIQELPPPPDSSKIDYYKNLDELCKCIGKLSLPSNWKINCGNIIHLYKIVSDIFNCIIPVFACCLPTDYEIYDSYKSSIHQSM